MSKRLAVFFYFFWGAVAFAAGGCNCSSSDPNRVCEEVVESRLVSKAIPRMVSPPADAELGPILGTIIRKERPEPGRYLASLAFSQSKYRTREVYISNRISGYVQFDIQADGTVTACFAGRRIFYKSASKYARGYNGGSRTERTSLFILGAMGKWRASENAISISFDLTVEDTCELHKLSEALQASQRSPIDMACVKVSVNDKLPTDSLMCKAISATGNLEDIALAPGNFSRAGPFALKADPSKGGLGPLPSDQWFIAGKTPGIHVDSKDDRYTSVPIVTFTKTEVTFRENQFRETKQQKERRMERERRMEEQNQKNIPPLKPLSNPGR